MWNGEESKMVGSEDSDDIIIPNVLADILAAKTIVNISRILCIVGPVHNWKNVADELGFSNDEINGDFAQNDGCKPAEIMLKKWFSGGGRLPELVKVFKHLKLLSCIEEIKDDAAFKKITKQHDDDGDASSSSGTESIHDNSTFQSFQGGNISDPPSEGSSWRHSLDDQELQASGERDVKITASKNNETLQKKENDFEGELQENDDKYQQSHSVITYTSWEYKRSLSEPGSKTDKLRKDFMRANSEDCSKKNNKKKPNKSVGKKPGFLKKLHVKLPKRKKHHSKNAFVEVQGCFEGKTDESTDLSPLKEGEIPSSIDGERPVSSSSEDSMPSSPLSQGYGSGPDVEVSERECNKSKKVYIVCNPEETDIFNKAIKLYLRFCDKGYQCKLFAMDLSKEAELGTFQSTLVDFMSSDYLFLCVSEKLQANFVEPCANPRPDDNYRRLQQISSLMMSYLSKHCCNKGGKIMTILLTEDSYNHIPMFLETYLHFYWPSQETKIENIIHGRPEVRIPISNHVEQAPQKVIGSKR